MYELLNDIEVSQRLADLDARLRKIEGIEPATNPPKPPTLIEAVEKMLTDLDAAYQSRALTMAEHDFIGKYRPEVLQALTREKRIAEARESLISAAMVIHYASCDCLLCQRAKHYDEVINETK